MKNDKENFEFVKESEDTNRNYIFQKDGITKKVALVVGMFLVVLVVAVVLSGVLVDFR